MKLWMFLEPDSIVLNVLNLTSFILFSILFLKHQMGFTFIFSHFADAFIQSDLLLGNIYIYIYASISVLNLMPAATGSQCKQIKRSETWALLGSLKTRTFENASLL